MILRRRGFSSGFCARASRSQMDLLRRTAPSASPAQRKKMSCAHEAHVSTRTARWRRPARSSRSRGRRWQAMGVERGGEEGACLPRSERLVACRQAASLETRTSYHSMTSATVLALASESDETSRRRPPGSQPIGTARCGAPESPAQRAGGSADPPRSGGQTVWPFQRTTGLATRYVDFSRYCLAD